MDFASEAFRAEAQLVDRAGRAVAAILPHDVECAPKGVCLECHYYIGSTTAAYLAYQFEVGPKSFFVDYEVWSAKLFGGHIIRLCLCKYSEFRELKKKGAALSVVVEIYHHPVVGAFGVDHDDSAG